MSSTEFDDGSGGGGDDSSASLTLGDGSGTAVLGGITNFLQQGGSAVRVLTASLVGLVVSPFVAIGDIIQAITAFFTTPFIATADSISALASALFQAPAGLVESGFAVTEGVLAQFLGDSLAGILAAPIAVAVTMLSLFIVVQYLEEDETGDTVPGLPIDVPTQFLGVEEEDDEVE